MRIVVCIKQVKALGDEVEFTDDECGVDPDYLEPALNEWDSYATEEALRIKEGLPEGSCEVVVVSVGDEEVDEAIRRCLAMGADRAIRVEGVESPDPLSIARALAEVARGESPDLVLCGVQSSDAVQAATGTALAEYLGLARVAVVKKLEWSGSGPARVQRELEGGLVDVCDVDTPAVLTIQSGINEPRYATLRAIKQAEQKEIEVRKAEGGGEPAYRVRRMFVPSKGEGAEMLGTDAAEVAQRIKTLVEERLR